MGFLFGSQHHQPDAYYHHYQHYGHYPGYGHPHQGFNDIGGPSQGHQVPYGYQGYQPVYHRGYYPTYHQQVHHPEHYPYHHAHYDSQQNPHWDYQQYNPYQRTPVPYHPFFYDEHQALDRENSMNQEDSY